MFSFFQTIIHQVIAIGAGLIIATGIVSVPELPPEPVQKKVIEVKQVETLKQKDKQTTAQATSGIINAASGNIPNKSAQVVVSTPVSNPAPTSSPVRAPASVSKEIIRATELARDYKISYRFGDSFVTFIAIGYRDEKALRGQFKWWSAGGNGKVTLNAYQFPAIESNDVVPVRFEEDVPLYKLFPYGNCGYVDHFFEFYLDRGNIEHSPSEPIMFTVADCEAVKKSIAIHALELASVSPPSMDPPPPPAPAPASPSMPQVVKVLKSNGVRCDLTSVWGVNCSLAVSFFEDGQAKANYPITATSDDFNSVFYCAPGQCAEGKSIDTSGDKVASTVTVATNPNYHNLASFNFSPTTIGPKKVTFRTNGVSLTVTTEGQVAKCVGYNVWDGKQCNMVDSISATNIDDLITIPGKSKQNTGSIFAIGGLRFSAADELAKIQEISYDSDIPLGGNLRLSGWHLCSTLVCAPKNFGLSSTGSDIFFDIDPTTIPIGTHSVIIKSFKVNGSNGQSRFATGFPFTFTYEITQ